MTHNHNHDECICVHDLGYCAKCDVAYCRKCNKEWGQYFQSWKWTTIFPQDPSPNTTSPFSNPFITTTNHSHTD